MNKSVILNCKNHKKCRLNEKGDCKLSHISLASEDGLKPDRLICEDFEPIPEKDSEATSRNVKNSP